MALEFYKKGQGYYTRLCSAIGAGIVTAMGCYRLYDKLEALGTIEMFSPTVKTWIRAGVPAAIFLALAWLIFKLSNAPRLADFMIATEGEMKKVSWSTRKEIISSTFVVIITVILMSVLLGVVDVLFSFLFYKMGILKIFSLS